MNSGGKTPHVLGVGHIESPLFLLRDFDRIDGHLDDDALDKSKLIETRLAPRI